MANVFKHFLRLLPLMLVASVGNDISITALLNPCGLNAGGATGLASVTSDWTGIPFALVYGVVNLPILFLGVRCLSLRYSLYSVFVTVVTTILFPYLQTFTIHIQPAMAALIAAVIYGVSIGVTYRYDFSLGGFSLLAKVLEVITRKKVGTLFTLVNFVPVILAVFTNLTISTLLWSIVFIVVTGEIINWTAMGKDYLKFCTGQCKKTFRFSVKIVHAGKHLLKVS